MPRFVKGIAVALAVLVGIVAAFFGAVVVGAILLVLGLFALLGRGRVKATVHRGPGVRRPGSSVDAAAASGDVIDIEARKVEAPRELN